MKPNLNALFQGHRGSHYSGATFNARSESCGEVTVASGRLAVTTVHWDLQELISLELARGSYPVEIFVAEARLVGAVLRLDTAAPERWESGWTLFTDPLLFADRSTLLRLELEGVDWFEDWIQWSERAEAFASEFRVFDDERLIAARSGFNSVAIVYLGYRAQKLVAIGVTCGELEGEDPDFIESHKPDYYRLQPRFNMLKSLGQAVNSARQGKTELLQKLLSPDITIVQDAEEYRGERALEALLTKLPEGWIEISPPIFPEQEELVLELAILPQASACLGELSVHAQGTISRIVLPKSFRHPKLYP